MFTPSYMKSLGMVSWQYQLRHAALAIISPLTISMLHFRRAAIFV